VSSLTHRARVPLAACSLAVLGLAGADAAFAGDDGHAMTGGTAPTAGAKLHRDAKDRDAKDRDTKDRGADDAPVAVTGYVFPIRGRHSYGTSINRFGAPRSGHTHKGQDVLAPAGTRLVAARGGRVTHRAFQGAAGNYLVIAADDGTDHVYMHLQGPARVSPGARVRAGEPIGRVGQTGDATAPHLHFEIWTAHWYDGGHPLDPLARLRAWDALS
jgi:murein DD-endopeptidase MepM/ murein hydrolase activator NlpD